MTEDIYDGVIVRKDRLYNSDFQTIIVQPGAIRASGFTYDGKCHQPTSIDADIVFNWSTFDACNLINTGLKIDGDEVRPYNTVSYAPFLNWPGTALNITHSIQTWNKTPDAAQGVRYVVQNSAKNARWNYSDSSIKAWAAREPRQLVGHLPNGSTVITSVRGRDASVGWTLHEAAEYGLSLGLINMIDGDGGGSVGTSLRFTDGLRDTFRGTTETRAVPSFGYIQLMTPLVREVELPPPPGVVKTFDIDVFDNGSISVNGVIHEP